MYQSLLQKHIFICPRSRFSHHVACVTDMNSNKKSETPGGGNLMKKKKIESMKNEKSAIKDKDITKMNNAHGMINSTLKSETKVQKYDSGLSLWPKNIFKNKYDSKIFNLAIPALLTLAADPLLSIIDTIYVGRLGSNELGALGVNTGIFALAFITFNCLATTTTPMVAAALATEDRYKASQVTVQAFILSSIIGLSLFGSLVYFGDSLLGVMGATGDIYILGKEYLMMRSFAAPAVLLCLSGQGIFRGMQDTKTPLVITLLTNAVNFILDPIFIFGMGMGVKGAALSTSLAECCAAASYCVILWQQRHILGLDCSFMTAINRARANYLPFLQNGATSLLRSVVLLGTKVLASSTATHLGPINIASHQVMSQLWLLHSLMSDSLSVAGQSLIAVSLCGQKNIPLARRISNRLIELGFGLGLSMTIIFILSSSFLPYIFTNDEHVVSGIYNIFPIAIYILPINSIAYVLDGIFIGAEDFLFLAWSMTATAFITSSGLLMVEPFTWGLQGIWCCQSGHLFLRMCILLYRYYDKNGPFSPSIVKQQLEQESSKISSSSTS